jgi:hypothetical protein
MTKKVRPVPVGLVLPTPKTKPEPIDNTSLVNDFRASGGQILHVPPRQGRRGVTAAFRILNSRIELATAVQHRADTFTKKIGTRTAIAHFHAGHTIFLPISRQTKKDVISDLSGFLNYYL